MSKKRIVLMAVNALPVLVSVLIYLLISQNDLRLWVIYDALVVPIYLLTFNFILGHRAFWVWKLLVILAVELICITTITSKFLSDNPQSVQKSDQSCSSIIVGHDWSCSFSLKAFTHNRHMIRRKVMFLYVFKQTHLSVFKRRKRIEIFKNLFDISHHAMSLALIIKYLH